MNKNFQTAKLLSMVINKGDFNKLQNRNHDFVIYGEIVMDRNAHLYIVGSVNRFRTTIADTSNVIGISINKTLEDHTLHNYYKFDVPLFSLENISTVKLTIPERSFASYRRRFWKSPTKI